jgi:hypothetical protein
LGRVTLDEPFEFQGALRYAADRAQARHENAVTNGFQVFGDLGKITACRPGVEAHQVKAEQAVDQNYRSAKSRGNQGSLSNEEAMKHAGILDVGNLAFHSPPPTLTACGPQRGVKAYS